MWIDEDVVTGDGAFGDRGTEHLTPQYEVSNAPSPCHQMLRLPVTTVSLSAPPVTNSKKGKR